ASGLNATPVPNTPCGAYKVATLAPVFPFQTPRGFATNIPSGLNTRSRSCSTTASSSSVMFQNKADLEPWNITRPFEPGPKLGTEYFSTGISRNNLPVPADQMRAVVSSPVVTTRPPSGLNRAWRPVILETIFPVATSQMITLLLFPAVTIHLPLELK